MSTLTDFQKFNPMARIVVRGILGRNRDTYLLPIERFFVNNPGEDSLRSIASEFGLPESTLRSVIKEVRSELAEIVESEGVSLEEFLREVD
ncbi:MAG: hypothetical protein KF805_12270 [Phycisphaeraceae bacterium]|nr:hypothetical protein [Phycisphaeraceae bacterium]